MARPRRAAGSQPRDWVARAHFFGGGAKAADFRRRIGRCISSARQDLHERRDDICFVVGDSKIHGQIVNNADALKEAAAMAGFSAEGHVRPKHARGEKVLQSRSRADSAGAHPRFQTQAAHCMKNGVLTLHLHDYTFFPYERDLARREVAALVGGSLHRRRAVLPCRGHEQRCESLAVELIARAARTARGRTKRSSEHWSNQHHAVMGHRHRRQSTRYSVHGLHEYKGKSSIRRSHYALLTYLRSRPAASHPRSVLR